MSYANDIIIRMLEKYDKYGGMKRNFFSLQDWENVMKQHISEYNVRDHINNIRLAATNFRYMLSTDDVLSAMWISPMYSRIMISGEHEITEDVLLENIFEFIISDMISSYGDDHIWVDIIREIGNDLEANKDDLLSENFSSLCNELTTVSGHVGSYELSYRMISKRKWRRCQYVTTWSWYGELRVYILPNLSQHNFRYLNMLVTSRDDAS